MRVRIGLLALAMLLSQPAGATVMQFDLSGSLHSTAEENPSIVPFNISVRFRTSEFAPSQLGFCNGDGGSIFSIYSINSKVLRSQIQIGNTSILNGITEMEFAFSKVYSEVGDCFGESADYFEGDIRFQGMSPFGSFRYAVVDVWQSLSTPMLEADIIQEPDPLAAILGNTSYFSEGYTFLNFDEGLSLWGYSLPVIREVPTPPPVLCFSAGLLALFLFRSRVPHRR